LLLGLKNDESIGSLVWNYQRRYALFEWGKNFLKKGFDLVPKAHELIW
jgi:hypothetical protein